MNDCLLCNAGHKPTVMVTVPTVVHGVTRLLNMPKEYFDRVQHLAWMSKVMGTQKRRARRLKQRRASILARRP